MANVIGQVGCLNILLVGLGLGAGLLLDRMVGTDGIFAVILTVASVPIALYLTMKIALKAVQQVQEQYEQKNATQNKDESQLDESEAT